MCKTCTKDKKCG